MGYRAKMQSATNGVPPGTTFQVCCNTSPHSPWPGRLRGSTRAHSVLVHLLDNSRVLFCCLKAPDRKPTRSRMPGCTWRGRYCAEPPEPGDKERCTHDAQQDPTDITTSGMCGQTMHVRKTKGHTKKHTCNNKRARRPLVVSREPSLKRHALLTFASSFAHAKKTNDNRWEWERGSVLRQ